MREEVGLPLSVGVARTKHLAKVASRAAKPDGLLLVPAEEEIAFLHPMPVEALWGVGPATAARLHERGIHRVEHLAAVPGAALAAMLGARRAGTCTPSPTTATRGRCGHAGGAGRWARSPRSAPGRARQAELDAVLMALADRVTRRMRSKGLVGRTITLRLRFGDFTRAARSRSWPRPRPPPRPPCAPSASCTPRRAR